MDHVARRPGRRRFTAGRRRPGARAAARRAADPRAEGLSGRRPGRAAAGRAGAERARAYESGASTASRLGSASHAPAVIRAAQLAILGKSREEIEVELRTELGIERPGEIVDEILPPG